MNYLFFFIFVAFAVCKPEGSAKELTSHDFFEFTLVKFYAPWCGHCRNMEQAYNKLAEHFAGNDRVLIAQVNGDRHSSTLRQFDIGGYPTLKYFPMGKQIVEDAHCGRDFESMRDFMERKIAEGSL